MKRGGGVRGCCKFQNQDSKKLRWGKRRKFCKSWERGTEGRGNPMHTAASAAKARGGGRGKREGGGFGINYLTGKKKKKNLGTELVEKNSIR